MKQRIKQILYDLRMQPLVGWVTIIATAMSVFLIMVVVMMQRVNTVPFAPESCRPMLLVGMNMHIKGERVEYSTSGISYDGATKLYGDLEGIKEMSYFSGSSHAENVSGTTKETVRAQVREVDDKFFAIFDHKLLSGRFFTDAESGSQLNVVVISKSVAERAFGTVDCINATLNINHYPYTVVGVVDNTTALASLGSGEVFKVTGPKDRSMMTRGSVGYIGSFTVAMLMEDDADIEDIRRQVRNRYASANTELARDSIEAVYHQQPYDAETFNSSDIYSNTDPDSNRWRNLRYLFYLILLIVPAINLSGMLHSRLSRRVSEIGIRRAFGCTRARIISDIVVENMIVTLVGGLLGLIAGVIFASTYTGLYESWDNYGQNLRPALSSIINWGTILIALGVCLVLNIISASIPAWQAAHLDPVEAINSK